ncbi:hypothetical protein BIU90_13525 [Curtobacterium sp. MCBA15_001]|nr:hypothetical protein BIU90_13525 [Curtobacterium sp. MCBA15_001]
MAVVVVALVVLDVVMIALALARTAPESNGTPGPVPTFTSSPMATASATASSAPPTSGSTAAAGSTGSRHMLTASDAENAWRASSGSCADRSATVERTTDGGASWQPVDLGGDVRTVLALRADGATISAMTGTGDTCTPVVRTSVDGGSTWVVAPAGAAGAAVGPDGLILSSGVIASPCGAPREVYQGQYTTAVVCTESVEWRRGAGAWVSVPVDGVRSLADAGDAYTIARSGVSGCVGVRVDSMRATGVTPETSTTQLGCAAGIEPGDEVVVARAAQAVWLWAGDDVRVSTDGGVTW